jgi:predicted DCC family thiol-disulfide oxidoreductase YuxK
VAGAEASSVERPGGTPAERRSVVLYDADCGICKWLLSLLLRWDRDLELRPLALQRDEADRLLSDLTPAERMATWHLVSPDGQRRSGGVALSELLRTLPGGRVPAAFSGRFPALTEAGYRWVAAHRTQLSRWVPAALKRHGAERVAQRERDLAQPASDP